MSATAQVHHLQPKDFKVNQAWLVFRANRAPLQSTEGDIDVFILQDAASLYIFGNVFAPAGTNLPDPELAAGLLRQAWATKNQWPTEILMPSPVPEMNGFVRAADWNGVPVRQVEAEQLQFFMEDVQSSYEEFLSRPDDGDA